MTELRTTSIDTWAPTQAFALAVVSLLVGVCGGWVVHRATAFQAPVAQQAFVAPSPEERTPPLPSSTLGGPPCRHSVC